MQELKGKKAADSRTEQLHAIMYTDINGQDRLFGGQLLKWMDEVAGTTARRHCGHNVATVAIDNMHFKAGAYLNDIIVLIGRITYVGTTSMEVRIDTYTEAVDGTRHPINRAYFVMVGLDKNDNPVPVPPLILENDAQRMEWENALKRKELRLMRRKEGY